MNSQYPTPKSKNTIATTINILDSLS